VTEDSIEDLVMSEDQWHTFMRPFVDAMCTLYPNKADHIEASAHEYSGPTLEELDVYGERVDTGLRVNDQPVWRYLRNEVHVCEVEPRGHIMFRWVEFDPD
jgi:hypothetical protein